MAAIHATATLMNSESQFDTISNLICSSRRPVQYQITKISSIQSVQGVLDLPQIREDIVDEPSLMITFGLLHLPNSYGTFEIDMDNKAL